MQSHGSLSSHKVLSSEPCPLLETDPVSKPFTASNLSDDYSSSILIVQSSSSSESSVASEGFPAKDSSSSLNSDHGMKSPDKHQFLPSPFTSNAPPASCVNTFRSPDGSSFEISYIDQLQRYSRLPLDAHRKIQQMGNEIVNYFEARLIHVEENPKIIEAFDAHVVFLKSPSTAQHWVMAFVKDHENRVHVKFNRLLTVHIRAVMQNPLTVEIEPSKTPGRPVVEQFIFNFETQRICTEFVRVLNICKKEIWTRRGSPLARKSWSANAIPTLALSPGRMDYNHIFADRKLRCKSKSSTRCTSKTDFGSNAFPVISSLYPETGTQCHAVDVLRHEDPACSLEKPKFLRLPYRMKFIFKNSALLSVRKDKNSQEYGTLGMGTIRIWGNDDCFDVLDFTAQYSSEKICSHPIYSWNAVSAFSVGNCGEWCCCWSAAADLLAAPTTLPSVREFRVLFPSKSVADSFVDEFEKSCTKASKPEIIFHCNHATSSWYPRELEIPHQKHVAENPSYARESLSMA